MKATGEWIDGRVAIPDLVRRLPQTRAVLDRYGLHGCGGESGPAETVEFFARAHDVPLRALIRELRQAAEQPGTAARAAPNLEDTIYRPFFKAGILVVLTLGAAWGALLLLRIGLTGEFRSAGLHEVNAHGHAQIFGWVGLFVMGFAYQAFPRFKHTRLAAPRLALAGLGVMLAGIVARSVCEPLAVDHPWLGPVAVAAALLEAAAIVVFVAIIVTTWRRSGKPLAIYDGYAICAFAWFILQALGEAVYLAATLAVTERDALVALVAQWQAPLREVQIHGFALILILGLSQRIFHPFYGLPAPRRGAGLALVLLNLAVIGEVAGLVLMRSDRGWAGLWYGSVLLLAATAYFMVRGWGIFGEAPDTDRSLKFLRAGYVWLFLSLGMLIMLPFYQFGLLPLLHPESEAARTGFSHAYYGAVRHAITVGFISLMIVGVAAKVVPTLNGLDVRALSGLWPSFVLINAGCTVRVVGQVLTDFTPAAYPVAGLSGMLEVAGLALWGLHLWAIMDGRSQAGAMATSGPSLGPGVPIRADHRVGDVLDAFPQLLFVFLRYGFTPLENAFFRHTFAPRVSIARACRTLDVDEETLLEALNRAAGIERPRETSPLTPNPEKGDQSCEPPRFSGPSTASSSRC